MLFLSIFPLRRYLGSPVCVFLNFGSFSQNTKWICKWCGLSRCNAHIKSTLSGRSFASLRKAGNVRFISSIHFSGVSIFGDSSAFSEMKPCQMLPLFCFEPSLHLVHLLLRYHSFIVEHARVLLQVFERRALACPLAFRGHILEHIFLARHIVERTLVRVSFPLFVRRIFRQTVRRVLNVLYVYLFAHFRELLNPSASNLSRYSACRSSVRCSNSLPLCCTD